MTRSATQPESLPRSSRRSSGGETNGDDNAPRRTSGCVPAAISASLLAALAAACGGQKLSSRQAVADGTPEVPVPIVGSASLAGKVHDVEGQAVSGATITMAETNATAISDEAGAYELMVPSDSTITLLATAPGFASTFRESVMLASQATIIDFDFLLLVPGHVTAINTLGAPGQESMRGVMAVRLHSLDPSCTTVGAQITVWPPLAATVVYSRPGADGATGEPDTVLTGVEDGAAIDLWLAGAMPPGNDIVLRVDQPGCLLMEPSPSIGGLVFLGQRHVVAGSATLAELFLDRTP